MKKKIIVFATLLVFSMLLSISLVLAVPPSQAHGPPAHLPRGTATIYVTSQGLYYDTIVPIDPDLGESLPWNTHNTGSFQELVSGTTEFGPGDPGYRGGRWWIDTDGSGDQTPGDTYFLCPLLGPGRESP
jgi:hypothetical protein